MKTPKQIAENILAPGPRMITWTWAEIEVIAGAVLEAEKERAEFKEAIEYAFDLADVVCEVRPDSESARVYRHKFQCLLTKLEGKK